MQQFLARLVLSLVPTVLLSAALAAAAEPVTVSVNTSRPGGVLSPDTLGLSYETSLMLPINGSHYFRPDNKPLVTIFKTLGVRSLRIGGNSVDAPNVPVPSEADVTAFFEFARAAGVKVIYSVRLEEPKGSRTATNFDLTATGGSIANCGSAARFAKLIRDEYADVIECFAIGNEPDYFRDYAVYKVKWKAIHDAIVTVYPEAKFCGPDQNPSPTLDRNMVRDFANPAGGLKMITQHSYPFGCSYKNPQARNDITKLIPFDAAESREKMLSPAAYDNYDRIYRGIAGAISGTPLSYRVTEANSYWFSGLKGASDSYASALWGVDYIYWWAHHGAAGINFHTGDRTGGDLSMVCRYAAFVTSPKGYEVRPLGYGMKLVDFGGHGRLLSAVSSETNLVAYAARDGQQMTVTLINKAHGADARERNVQIRLSDAATASKAEIIFLTANENDLGGTSADVTLGGARIDEDGTWKGRWTQLPLSAATNQMIGTAMPPASAAVVRISIRE